MTLVSTRQGYQAGNLKISFWGTEMALGDKGSLLPSWGRGKPGFPLHIWKSSQIRDSQIIARWWSSNTTGLVSQKGREKESVIPRSTQEAASKHRSAWRH